MSLKENWQQTGSDFLNAFKGLGKNIVKSAATGVKKVDDWANSEEEAKPEEEKTENTEE